MRVYECSIKKVLHVNSCVLLHLLTGVLAFAAAATGRGAAIRGTPSLYLIATHLLPHSRINMAGSGTGTRSPRGRGARTRTPRPNQDGGLGARACQERLAKGYKIALCSLLRLAETDEKKVVAAAKRQEQDIVYPGALATSAHVAAPCTLHLTCPGFSIRY